MGILLIAGAWAYNNTVVRSWERGIESQSNSNAKNNIVIGTAANYSGTFASSTYNISTDATASGTGSIASASATSIIKDTAYATFDCRPKNGSPAFDAGDSVGLSALFLNDLADTIRHYNGWDIGCREAGWHPFTWVGRGSTENWNEAANWEGGAAPGTTDTAFYGKQSNKNCVVNIAPSIKGMQISSPYAGTISQSTGNAITIGTGGFSQASGIFTGANKKVTVGGLCTITGGTFTSTSETLSVADDLIIGSATFNHNNCIVAMPGNIAKTISTGTAHLSSLSLGIGGTPNIIISGRVYLDSNLYLVGSSSMTGDTIFIAGNAVSGSLNCTSPLVFNGLGAQTLSAGSGTKGCYGSIIVDKSSGTLFLEDTISLTGHWVKTNGIVDAGTSVVLFTGSPNATITGNGTAFNHVVINRGSGHLTISGTMDINGNLNIVDLYSFQTGTVNLAGNLTFSDNSVTQTNNVAIVFDGAGNQTVSAVASAAWPTGGITISKASGKLTLLSDIVWPATVGLNSGVLEQGDYNLTTTGAFTISSGARYVNNGSGDLILGSTLTNNGTVYMNSFGGGSGDGDSIWIRSSVAGTPRTITGGATGWRLYDVNLQDITAGSGAADSIFVYSGTNTSGNTRCGFREGGVVPYSIGINSSSLFSTGTVSQNATFDTLTFSNALPANIGEGDKIILDFDNGGLGRDTVFVMSKLTTTTVALQAPCRYVQSGVDFSIVRSFNTLQAWEDARQNNLVAQRVIEKGACYNDGNFTASLNIAGSTTDASSYFWLTAAQGQMHTGRDGTGVKVRTTSTNSTIDVDVDYTRVNGLIVETATGFDYNGITCDALDVKIYDNIVIRGNGTLLGAAIRLYHASNSGVAYNNIVYGKDGYTWENGIKLSRGKGYNNTIYHCGTGIYVYGAGSGLAKNNISVYNTTDYGGDGFDAASNYNLSSDATAPGAASVLNISREKLFIDTSVSLPNFNLIRLAPAAGAGDSATLTAIYTTDILGITRLDKVWDIGAFKGVFPFLIAARSIGTNAAALYTGTGNGSTNATGDTITLSSGTFPANIGEGDSIRLTSV
ncbi:MAG: hypothetical protein JNL74_22745, partial [Fibrobacteres bacterium]|nr:hypothetical protein [Fibrobacterota bacterium]